MKITQILLFVGITAAQYALAEDPAVWPIVYAGNIHPLDAGSVKLAGGEATEFAPPAKENYLAEPGEEGLKFEFSAAGTFGLGLAETKYQFSEGTTFECRLRLEETVNRIDPPAKNSSAVMIQFSETGTNDPGLWSLGFYTDPADGKNYVVLEGANSTTAHEIGKEFHTYRVVTKDDFATLCVDGVAVGEVKPRKGVPPFGFRFGNVRGADHTGTAVLESIRIDSGKAWMP